MGITRKPLALALILSFGLSLADGFWSAFTNDPAFQNGAAEARRRRSSSRRTTTHRTRHHSRRTVHRAAPKTRYAYPLDFFMMHHPEFDKSPLPEELALKVRTAFNQGAAEIYPPNFLIRSGALHFYPLRGGIFKRRENVKYIVIHSTETGVPQDSKRVIDSWSSGGRRHPGTQYIVDRDGTTYCAVDPHYGAVHVNIFKTLPGINNDNTIGIEMCHAGSQTYPPEQKAAVTRLVAYLQDRFHVLNENVITHRYAQQGDHTDPVAFDWEGWLAAKDDFRNRALAYKRDFGGEEVIEPEGPVASVYLEMHKYLDEQEVVNRTQQQSAVPSITTGRPRQSIPGNLFARPPLTTPTSPATPTTPRTETTPRLSAPTPSGTDISDVPATKLAPTASPPLTSLTAPTPSATSLTPSTILPSSAQRSLPPPPSSVPAQTGSGTSLLAPASSLTAPIPVTTPGRLAPSLRGEIEVPPNRANYLQKESDRKVVSPDPQLPESLKNQLGDPLKPLE